MLSPLDIIMIGLGFEGETKSKRNSNCITDLYFSEIVQENVFKLKSYVRYQFFFFSVQTE